MPFRLGPLEIGIILVIIFIIFGVGKLPQVGEAIGKGLRAVRKGKSGEEDKEEATGKTKVKVIKKLGDDETTEQLTSKIAEDKTEPKRS